MVNRDVGLLTFTSAKKVINQLCLVSKGYSNRGHRRLITKSRHHDIGTFFSSMPALVLFILMVVGYALVVALGEYIGYQKHLSNLRVPETPMETAVGAIFALLAFMLGFTFSLTWTRFANRNLLVISQAQAIE